MCYYYTGDQMYALYAAGLACLLAQLLKPFVNRIINKEWNWKLMHSTGGMPSSHDATVSALALAVGLLDHFNSTTFAVVTVFGTIVCYDAANVRFYAGQNISLTERLITDLKELSLLSLDDPIYEKKMKDVLGHTYVEVFFGILLGLLVAWILYLIMF